MTTQAQQLNKINQSNSQNQNIDFGNPLIVGNHQESNTNSYSTKITLLKKSGYDNVDFQPIIIQNFDDLQDYCFYQNSESDQVTTAQKKQGSMDSGTKESFDTDRFNFEYEENINCPICGLNSTSNLDSTPLLVQNMKTKFLCHNECYKTLSSAQIKTLKNSVSPIRATIKSNEYINNQFHLNQTLNFSYFHAELTIFHPLSNIVYLQVQKKIPIENQNLIWNFFCQNALPFQANILCLPFTDFNVKLTVEIFTVVTVYEFHVNLLLNEKKYKLNKFIASAFSSDNVILQGQIIDNNKQKKILVDKMNYKYKYSIESYPMIKLNNIKFKIPQQHQNRLYQLQLFYMGQNQNQYLNSCEVTSNYSESSGYSVQLPQYQYQISNQNYYYFNQNTSQQQYQNLSQQYLNSPQSYQNTSSQYQTSTQKHLPQIQQIDNQYKPIYDAMRQKRIEEFVKTNTGSRQVQKFLKKSSLQDLELFINSIFDILQKLVACPYGNYTFQQLINVCPPEKKRILISKLGEHIPDLAKTKQGTHALQTLVSTLTFQAEIELIKKSIQNHILEISKDSNGTHFIQKILINFGNANYKHLQFIHIDVMKHFLTYAQDSNGVLVIKVLMNQIKEIDLLRNQLITKIENNLQTIIQDPYGNYIVQSAYDLFKQQRVKAITIKIMEKFVPYSVNKYASNVIINCLQEYCGSDFYKSVQSMFIKCKNYEDMSKSVSGQHILKLLFQKSQNKIFIEDVRNIFTKQKLQKFGWMELIKQPKNKNDKKQAQTVKIDNKSNFNTAVVENLLEKDSNFAKKKNNGNGQQDNNNISGTFTPSFKKSSETKNVGASSKKRA